MLAERGGLATRSLLNEDCRDGGRRHRSEGVDDRSSSNAGLVDRLLASRKGATRRHRPSAAIQRCDRFPQERTRRARIAGGVQQRRSVPPKLSHDPLRRDRVPCQ